jgi:hypothetical protein
MVATSVDKIQGLSGSLAFKAPCRVFSTGNMLLSGLQTVNGVALATGDRVVVKDQTNTAENGIYTADTSSWKRALDFNGKNDAVRGTRVSATDGNANAGATWQVDSIGVIGVDALTFGTSLSDLSPQSISTFTGDGGQTEFDIGADPGGRDNTQVFINGVYQHKSTYTVVGSIVALTTAPALGWLVEVVVLETLIIGAASAAAAAAEASAIAAAASEAGAVADAATASAAATTASAAGSAATGAASAAAADAATASTNASQAASSAASAAVSAATASAAAAGAAGSEASATGSAAAAAASAAAASTAGAAAAAAAASASTASTKADEASTSAAAASGSAAAAAASADSIAGGPVASVNGLTGIVTITKSTVGLPAADNTSDVDKPVSTLQAAAIAAAVAGAGDLTGFRNRLINGGFSVNQRAVSGTVVLSAGAYGHDRWKAGAAGCTYTFSTTANVTTITISAGSLQQVIDGVNLTTDTYSLSWTGTAQGKIAAGAYSATGVTGSITGGTNTTIEFNAGTLTGAQLISGTAQPFEFRPYSVELAMCQRYLPYNSGASVCGTGHAYSTTQALVEVSFKTTPRVAPTGVVASAATNFSLWDGTGSLIACTAVALYSSSTSSALLQITVASGLTAGRGTSLMGNGSLRLEFTGAEL